MAIAGCSAAAPAVVGTPAELSAACARYQAACRDGAESCENDRYECYRLSLWYDDGLMVPRDPKRAHAMRLELCAEGDPSSCDKLCQGGSATHCADIEVMHLAATGGSPYPPIWRDLTDQRFGAACRKGDRMACLLLHLDYRSGEQPVVKLMNDCSTHRRCYEQACTQGDPVGCAASCREGGKDACATLAVLGIEGSGFRDKRPREALEMAEPFCERGDAKTCAVVGTAYHLGIGLAVDYVRARALYQKACPAVPEACSSLGVLYADGLGVERDRTQAATYFTMACDAGYDRACEAARALGSVK